MSALRDLGREQVMNNRIPSNDERVAHCATNGFKLLTPFGLNSQRAYLL
jgi:hypothetical protein